MFTGIIDDIGVIRSAEGKGIRRFTIATRYAEESISIGASIACDGICLTVVEKGSDAEACWFRVEAAPETLAVTTARAWEAGSRINLERALRVGDELGGHFVTGHVDALAVLIERTPEHDACRMWFTFPSSLEPFIAPKGSVTLNGVSLTVNAVEKNTFSVMLIPHTLAVTTLGDLREGEALNLEIDVLARYAARML